MKTLQDLCLEQIMQDFDRHILAYSTFTNLKQSYEALRRRFSHELILQMQEKYDGIRAEYIDFLINKYLKTLDTDWLDNCPWDLIEKKFAEIGPGLESIQFCGEGKLHWENIFCHLPNLKVVYFFSCEDTYLDCISKFCPKIESISLGVASEILPNGFQYLCGNERLRPCPQLKEIILVEPNEISGDYEGFQPKVEDVIYLIKNLPLLEKINYNKLAEILYSIHKDDLNNLNNVKPYNLTYLDIPSYDNQSDFFKAYDDALKICLSLCPHLKTLACPALKQEHLHLCSELTELQHLSLSNFKDSPIELDDFLKAKGNRLISLSVYNFSLSAAHLVQASPLLDTLQLSKITFLNDGHDTVPDFCNLKKLTFEHMSMIENDTLTAKAVTYFLASSPCLESLTFKDCAVFSSDIKIELLKCCEHGKIWHISFIQSTVEAKFLLEVHQACHSLRSLNLDSSEIAGIEADEEFGALIYSLSNGVVVIFRSMHNDSYSDDDEDSYSIIYNSDYSD